MTPATCFSVGARSVLVSSRSNTAMWDMFWYVHSLVVWPRWCTPMLALPCLLVYPLPGTKWSRDAGVFLFHLDTYKSKGVFTVARMSPVDLMGLFSDVFELFETLRVWTLRVYIQADCRTQKSPQNGEYCRSVFFSGRETFPPCWTDNPVISIGKRFLPPGARSVFVQAVCMWSLRQRICAQKRAEGASVNPHRRNVSLHLCFCHPFCRSFCWH